MIPSTAISDISRYLFKQSDISPVNHSDRSTPVPEDAPPSAHSISTARAQVRARRRLFYTIDYVPRVSHFDPRSDYHNFRGFFALFWIALAIMVFTTVLRNIKDTGYPLRVRVWSILSANVWELGLSDLAMVVSSGLVLLLQKVFRSRGWLRWRRGGMAIQSVFEAAWLALWIKWVIFYLRRGNGKLTLTAGRSCCAGPGRRRSSLPSTP